MDKNNIKVVTCKDKQEASKQALVILSKDIDQDSLLLLSGGTSPDLLYRLIAQEKLIKPGAVALIDERFGLPMHENSNEKMIAETGLLEYLNNEEIPFYNILGNGGMEELTQKYEQTIKDLYKKFTKKIAIMGIGADAHTAGIKPNLEYDHTKFVVSYDDVNGVFGKRISLTFEALSEIGEFIILALGESKKDALEKIFQEQDQQKFPAVFYNRLDYSLPQEVYTKTPPKVVLITDIEFIH